MPARSADWPQALGPNGDNIAPTLGISTDLDKWGGVWKTNVGSGDAPIVIAGGKAYAVGQAGKSQETLYCFDAATGTSLWRFSYDSPLGASGEPGRLNATPTVFGGKVYSVSRLGMAFCLSADTGAKIWDVNLEVAMRISRPTMGFTASPVIYKDKVLFTAGKVIALDQATGKKAWVSVTNYPSGSRAPAVFQRDDQEFIAAADAQGLSILASVDGREVARRTFKAPDEFNVNSPMTVPNGRRLVILGSFNTTMYGFDGKALTENWTSTELKSGPSSAVRVTRILFGLNGPQAGPTNRLICMNWDDGHARWVQSDFDHGTMIGIGTNVLLTLTENGELVTLWAARKNFGEISRIPVLSKPCWTAPVFAEDRIYVRNEKGDVVCLGRK